MYEIVVRYARRIPILKEFITNLDEKLDALKDEVKFLREDSAKKSAMIDNLISITRQSALTGKLAVVSVSAVTMEM